jgi:hypothetical protein
VARKFVPPGTATGVESRIFDEAAGSRNRLANAAMNGLRGGAVPLLQEVWLIESGLTAALETRGKGRMAPSRMSGRGLQFCKQSRVADMRCASRASLAHPLLPAGHRLLLTLPWRSSAT